jgi:predicted metal-dependent hydrolase
MTARNLMQEHLELPDGEIINFQIHSSNKSRSIRLKVSARDGLVVTVPSGIEHTRVLELVASKSEWINVRLSEFKSVHHLLQNAGLSRPKAFNLAALGESWIVEYQSTKSKTVGARTDQQGRIVVAGNIEDMSACQAALRRWLARHAKVALSKWVDNVSKQTGLQYFDLSIKNQRTRWGSCSAQRRLSLNCKLLFLARDQVRYVIVHELCHTLEHNHSSRFWMHLRQFEPNADWLHGKMRDAWKLVPVWAQKAKILEL